MGAANRRRAALGLSYGAAAAWAWHYTLGRKIPRILRDGALRDAWMDRNRETYGARAPYSIWFTTAGKVDPTSTPALTRRGSYANDPDLFKRMTGGHWRIGFSLPHPALMTYSEALALHPPSSRFGGWYRQLASCGENRNQWRIADQPVPLTGCRIEELQGDQWVAHALDSLSHDQAGPGYGEPGLMEMDAVMPASGSLRLLVPAAREVA